MNSRAPPCRPPRDGVGAAWGWHRRRWYWHALLLGFDTGGKSYQINTWYQPDIENQALQVYKQVKKSFTVL